jgi:hypothetical protein
MGRASNENAAMRSFRRVSKSEKMTNEVSTSSEFDGNYKKYEYKLTVSTRICRLCIEI